MTYFNFRSVRGSRGQDVYVRSTLVGRVSTKADWRSRLTLREATLPLYQATAIGGEVLPGLFPSRHDAAEALYTAFRSARPDLVETDHLV